MPRVTNFVDIKSATMFVKTAYKELHKKELEIMY